MVEKLIKTAITLLIWLALLTSTRDVLAKLIQRDLATVVALLVTYIVTAVVFRAFFPRVRQI